jgi:tRNA pseudouridine13 synthase
MLLDFGEWLKKAYAFTDAFADPQELSLPPDVDTPTLHFREQLEDFEVEESLAFTPSQEGNHFLCWIEKQGLSTQHLVQRISERWKIQRKHIGFAGRKDQRGITRQWISLPVDTSDAQLFEDLQIPGARILKVVRNSKKLRLGQLRFNRFRIFLRGNVHSLTEFEERWSTLIARGLPNYFGHQRFGYGYNNLPKMVPFLRKPQKARRTKEKFLVSVFQSICFNHWLSQRLRQDLLPHAMPGDVMLGLPFGQRPFEVEALQATQERIDNGELTVCGPLPGPKAFAASLDAADFETSCWQEMGLNEDWLMQHPALDKGARRAAFVPVLNASFAYDETGLRLSFDLPKGSYATVCLEALLPGQIRDFALPQKLKSP